MENLPVYVSILFALTTLVTILFLYKATNNSKFVLGVIVLWLIVQTAISLTGFYTDTHSVPPHLAFLLLPPVVFIIILFFTRKGRTFIDSLDIKVLTLLHTIRVPVEVVLFLLLAYKMVPQIMTFEGRNFDILSGITAPLIYYFGFVKKQLSEKVMVVWNLICLGLLINIVVTAILSAPFPFQKFAFDQPNVAILYFPFVWLPGCVVPIVLFSHLATIRQLLHPVK